MSRKIKIVSLLVEGAVLWLYLPLLVGAQPPITRIAIFPNNLNLVGFPMTVKVLEHLYGEWTILESRPKNYVKEENLVVYEVEVPAGQTKEIQYKVRAK